MFSFCIISVTAILLVALKVFLKLKTGWDRSATCLIGKTAIVTGANTGIGFYTAQDFAKRGARVILACRDKSKAEAARRKIVAATGNDNVLVKILDLSSLASVRKFAKDVNETEKNLHILVNNAGLIVDKRQTEDGLDQVFQVNHLGPFLLTILLIGLMKSSAPGRIVNVSSKAARIAKLNVNKLGVFPTGRLATLKQYGNTKLCNILFTNELARRLKNTDIQVNSLHPGAVSTELGRNMSGLLNSTVAVIGKLFHKTSEEGAQTSIYLAVSKNVELISGEYFDNCKIQTMPKEGRDQRLARQVWVKSEELVKLTKEEQCL